MEMLPKNRNKIRPSRQGFTLVELMIVVSIIGILAAIAIPAFRRYIVSTRIAESELHMDWMTKGAISYYNSEQKYSGVSGDQPWHVGNPASGQADSSGMPVSSKVFPGRDYSFNTTDGEGQYLNCSTAPKGGSKVLGVMSNNTPLLKIVRGKLKLASPGAIYFQYAYQAADDGPNATVDIAAVADFKPGGLCHTRTRRIAVHDSEVSAGPVSTINEFQ